MVVVVWVSKFVIVVAVMVRLGYSYYGNCILLMVVSLTEMLKVTVDVVVVMVTMGLLLW